MRLIQLALLSSIFWNATLYAASCNSALPNLVANCGFESGNFTSWTLSGYDSSPAYNGIDYGVDVFDAHSGVYGAYLGGFGGVLNLSQPIPTTPGGRYTLSFWLAQSPAPASGYLNSFNLSFGSATQSLAQAPTMPFTQYTIEAVASASTTPLTFGFRDDAGFFSIDDVSVTATLASPEPAGSALATLAAALLVAGLAVRLRWSLLH